MRTHPDVDELRCDAYTNLLSVARVAMWRASRSTVDPSVWTSIPTRKLIMERTGLRLSAVKKWIRWLRERGFLATVVEGSTPRFRPGTRCGTDDDGAANLGAEYALLIPLATTQTPAKDTTGASACPSPVEETRPPSVVLSDERTTEDGTPNAGARTNAQTGQSAHSSDTARTWPLSATPGTKVEMLQAAQALRAHSPILRKITAKHLRSLLREYFRAGWTAGDVLHGLDHTPYGTSWTYTHPPQWIPGWIRHRLILWHTPDGTIRPSPSQQAAARQQVAAQARQAARAEHERRLAHSVDAAAPAAAARAALAAASPTAAKRIHRRDADSPQPSGSTGHDLYIVKIMAPDATPATSTPTGEPNERRKPTGGHRTPVAPSRAPDASRDAFAALEATRRLVEPEAIFQREVIDRHRLPGEPGEDAGAMPNTQRAWLARVFAAQRMTDNS
ncbi:hypothetical protein [Nonomuraea sp. B19D2]|uniref:hypothetical protein n=1 Tax=Nonomuraea sp. B19D2 TaxID=3159561 RepID=UPI0032D9BE30